MRRDHKSVWSNAISSVCISAAAGISISIICMMIFAAFTFFFMDSMEFSDFFSRAALVLGGFIGGRFCGKHRRRKGLAEGLICGAVMYAVLSLASIITDGSLPVIKKLLLLAISCAAGGVVGVNSKRPKKLRND